MNFKLLQFVSAVAMSNGDKSDLMRLSVFDPLEMEIAISIGVEFDYLIRDPKSGKVIVTDAGRVAVNDSGMAAIISKPVVAQTRDISFPDLYATRKGASLHLYAELRDMLPPRTLTALEQLYGEHCPREKFERDQGLPARSAKVIGEYAMEVFQHVMRNRR
jgi:hypothetical protein